MQQVPVQGPDNGVAIRIEVEREVLCMRMPRFRMSGPNWELIAGSAVNTRIAAQFALPQTCIFFGGDQYRDLAAESLD